MTTAAAIVLLRDTLLLLSLAFIAVALTFAMFRSADPLLGFPSGIFWAILSGYCYTESAATWDIYYFVFFASAGMLIFSIYAAFALRKKDLGPPDADKEKFFDEEQPADLRGDVEKGGNGTGDEEEASPRQKAIRERASKRRSREPKPRMRSW